MARDERKRNVEYYAANKERENARCREYHRKNREKRLAKKAVWREANREAGNESSRARYWADPEASREYYRQWRIKTNNAEYQRAWRERNAERLKELARKWVQENKARVQAKTAARRARKIQATPPWADLDAIRVFYEEAARLTAETGVPHEVDHILPLKGETICGLHVQNNLRVVTQPVNRKKHIKLEAGSEDFWPSDHTRLCWPEEGAVAAR